ncbi:MAG: type I 3-dehydroquinate dehydratase [Syntrophales bacterium]|nr:type I 3-dehydroquinate dehydratase [Syntrophales bacterium]
MICVSILPETEEEAKDLIIRASGVAKAVELRIDRLKFPNLELLRKFCTGYLVVTNRRREDGGYFDGTEEERIESLKEAVISGADYVDVELGSDHKHIDGLRELIDREGNRTRLIISHHDLSGTPPLNEMKNIYSMCRSLGADVVKIVTNAHSVADSLRVLNLITWAHEAGEEIIAYAMGKAGVISRVMAILLGGHLNYVYLDGEYSTGTGQLSLTEMIKILEMVGRE